MKKLIVIVVLIVVIAAGLPLINGILFERIIKNSVDDANAMYENFPFGLSIEIADYNRSYLKTDMVYKVNVEAFNNIPDMEPSFTIEENAKHGFFSVSSETSLIGNELYKKFITENLKGKDPLHIASTYSLFGGIESNIILDAFSIDMGKEKLQVKKAEINIDTDQKVENLKISANWQGIEAAEKASLGEISITTDLELIEPLVMDGETEIQLKSLEILESGKEFKISDFKIQDSTNVDVDANTIGGNTFFSIGSIHADSNNVEGATARLVIKGLRLDVYKEFIENYFDMLSQMMAKMDINNPVKSQAGMQQEFQQMGLNMVALYEKFLKKDLELQISDVSVKLPKGEVKGGITLKLLKDMTFAQFLPLAGNPQGIFDIIYLKTDINLPVKLVGEMPQLTQPAVPDLKTGLFVKDGDYLVNKLETKDGKLILNGNEVPLEKIASQINPGPSMPPAGNPYMQ